MMNRELVCEAWRLRLNQDLEGFFTCLLKLRHLLPNVPPEKLGLHDLKNAGLEFSLWEEISLLHVAFLRTQSKWSEASGVFESIERLAYESCEKVSPRFYMERGLNYLAQSNHYNALEDFLRARDPKESEYDRSMLRLQSRINTIICLEALHLPLTNEVQEFSSELESFREIPGIDGIRDQWEAFRLRRSVS